MFCIRCGMKNDDDALFCAGCGSVMSKSQPVQPQTESNLQSQTEVYAQQEGNVQLQAEGNTQSEQDVTVQPQQEVNVSEETYGVSLEKAQTEETPSETAENTVEPMSSFGEPVQVESVEPRNFSQPQFGAQQQNIGQPQFGSQPQFGTQSQSFGQSQFGSQPQNFGQPSFGGPQFSNPQPVNAKKFSVKRFVFSALIIIASILACACVAFNYVGIKMSMKVQGEGKETQKQYIKGYKIIKDKADVDLLDEMDEYDKDSIEKINEISDIAKKFRIVVIIFEVALVLFTIIDLILLTVVRKRAAYIFTMLFGLIKAAIGGIAMWLWCFEFLDAFKDYIELWVGDILEYGLFTFGISASLGIGLILAMAMQAVVVVCSIVLLTCKNRQKGLPQV